MFQASAPTLPQLQALGGLESFTGFGGVPLKVVQRSYAPGADLDEVIAGRATPDRIYATQDGRVRGAGWHSGPEAEGVYYEDYEVREGVLVMVSHGWVDAASRQIVQVG